MAEKEWLTVLAMEKETGIADSTLRRYIRNHGHNLEVKKRGKSYLISSESIPVIKKIRELYEKGKQSEDIEESLRMMNIPVTITMTDDDQEKSIGAGEALIQLQKDMKEQKEFNEKLLEAIKEQNEQMKRQQEYIEQKLEARDQKLMESLKESMEARKQIAASEDKQKRGFWARLFNK
jgi:hypothetical protein